MKSSLFNEKYKLPLSRLLVLKNLLIVALIWLFVYSFQMSNFLLSSIKEFYFFEIVGVWHSIFFIIFFFIFSLRIRRATTLFIFVQIIIGLLLIYLYSHGYQLISDTYFVPNASDAILYTDFANSSIKDGWLQTTNKFIEKHGAADFGASTYVYLVYLIFPDSPISVYFINLFLASVLVFILKVKGENAYYRALRLTLLINPFLFYLIITSFKELPMICLLLMALRFFYHKRWLKCAVCFLLLIFFRPAISALFLAAILISIGTKNLNLIFTKFKVNKKILLIIPITVTFLVTFPLLLKFLKSGLLATLDYYSDSPGLSSYSIPVAFAASFITGFFGPLYKPFSYEHFSLGILYSFFYPIGALLNLFCFNYIKNQRKIMTDSQITLFIFIILGILSISVMLRGFELRYTLIFYIALWWLTSSIYSGLSTNHINRRNNR